MTTRTNTQIDLQTNKAYAVSWAGLLNGDDGIPVRMSQYSDKSVQVVGTFGAGGALALEGSNDGTNWAVLSDPQGNPLSITSAKIEAVIEAVGWVRPRVTAGDGTTNLTAIVLLKE